MTRILSDALFPMPLPVRSRRYDEQFWKELLGGKEKRSKEQNLKELGF
jgi:hypothetical protein